MKFQIDWQPHAPNAALEERATIADLRIAIGGGNACANEQQRRRGQGVTTTASRNVRRTEYATVSVYPLAAEIAFNWWHLFGSRDAKLQLADGRGGYAVPNIQLTFDGAGFTASCRPLTYDNPPIRFTHGDTERLTRAEAESALADFVDDVQVRLAEARGAEFRSAAAMGSRATVERECGRAGVPARQRGRLALIRTRSTARLPTSSWMLARGSVASRCWNFCRDCEAERLARTP